SMSAYRIPSSLCRGPATILPPGARLFPVLCADQHEGHERRLRQWIAPAMAGAILHHTVALTKMDRLSIVKLQDHFAAHNYSVVHAIRRVHSQDCRARSASPCLETFARSPRDSFRKRAGRVWCPQVVGERTGPSERK